MTFKYITYLLFLVLVISSLYLINLFSSKPYSIDHYLAKELIVGVLDSPEYMTYLGIFDGYNWVLGHNSQLSIPTPEDAESDYQDNLKTLSILKNYDVKDLNYNQRITQKIAVFDTENDIKEAAVGIVLDTHSCPKPSLKIGTAKRHLLELSWPI